MGPRSSCGDRWRILAAVRATGAEAEEKARNAHILEWALMLKARGDAELTVLQAWLGGSVFAVKPPGCRSPVAHG
jgi:hypothetical protein